MRSVVWSQSPCECQCVAEFTQVQRVIRAETAVKAEPVSAAIVSAHTDWTSRAGPDDTLVFHQHSVISAPPQGSSCVMAGVFFTHTHFIFKLLNIFLITLPTRLNLQDAVVLTERHVSPPSSVWGHYWSHSSTAAPHFVTSGGTAWVYTNDSVQTQLCTTVVKQAETLNCHRVITGKTDQGLSPTHPQNSVLPSSTHTPLVQSVSQIKVFDFHFKMKEAALPVVVLHQEQAAVLHCEGVFGACTTQHSPASHRIQTSNPQITSCVL